MRAVGNIFFLIIFSWIRSGSSTGRITPLHADVYNNSSACIAENLRLSNKYTCDSKGNVICLAGWSEPEKLCNTPICNINGRGCINGKCIFPNVCSCDIGWDGPSCNECIPLAGCRHGTCVKALECNCEPGWTGQQCEKAECKDCVNGCCHEPNKCICDPGWQGHNCTECLTLSSCRNGKCISHPFECVCNPGWQGLGCSKPICRESCHPTNGYCKFPGECICRHGWTGRDCFDCVPYPGCNGTCVNNVPWTCSDLGPNNEGRPGQWSNWSLWSACSKSCGEGSQKRARTCGDPTKAAHNCIGKPTETRSCVIENCKVDGSWARWTKWSPCSSSCGTGFRSRSRACSDPIPRYGGNKCPGQNQERIKCFSTFCPIAGRWSSWQSWSPCSASCGDGSRQRLRKCDSPAPAYGGVPCIGEPSERGSCNLRECPVDAEWTVWSPWTACSKSCGEGRQERTRRCTTPLFGGRTCPGNRTVEKDVVPCWIQQVCSIDGKWSPWQEWSDCSVTCGGGSRLRTRDCNNPAPKFGGRRCIGNELENQGCGSQSCPVDGKWSLWRQWSACTKSCGSGVQDRKRACNDPQFGGNKCKGVPSDQRKCNQQNCPVDGAWSLWGRWTTCSASCNGGTQSRKRTCSQPKFGGQPCIGNSVENKNCNQQSCSIDGQWSLWSQWSICSKTCKGGNQKRERSCSDPQFGGKPCTGPSSENRQCNDKIECPIDGQWALWGRWSTCSSTCSGGTQSRNRKCNRPQFGGKSCQGSPTDNRSCNQQISCPVDGSWSQWGLWSSCSSTCKGGNQKRERTCNEPQFGGRPCAGLSVQNQPCNQNVDCPVDGKWAQWGRWTTCSSTCRGGNQRRERLCSNPRFGGSSCPGQSFQNQQCNSEIECPVHGEWGQWGFWSICSSTCNGGTQTRNRACNNPQFGGLPCRGSPRESRSCNQQISCPIHGEWGEWRQWSICSSTCTGGIQKRDRPCNDPQFGGLPCNGQSDQSQECNQNIACPVDGKWAEWGLWSTCSSTCNGGSQTRDRVCIQPSFGGQLCIGQSRENQPCNQGISCPIHGEWGQWGFWSSCSSTCADGIQKRNRACNDPQFGGLPCNGQSEQTQKCNQNIACPVDGEWGQWGLWSTCSSTCNGGSQARDRVCIQPSFGGQNCRGQSRESQPCNQGISCPIHGEWGQWGFWSSCSSTCNGGTQKRNRQCNSPQFGGLPCNGQSEQIQQCNQNIECEVDGKWGQWRYWSSCSSTCNGGTQTRERSCISPISGGRHCIGNSLQKQPCNQHISCPIHGEWGQWGFWSTCSSSCDGGIQRRERPCNSPLFGGLPCNGQSEESQPCNENVNCPVDGQWSQWGYWSSCSVTCDGGTQTRERSCKNPRFGGIYCSGSSIDSQNCNEQACISIGFWSQWSYWSSCSVTCDSGIRERHRACENGMNCQGSETETSHCNDRPCFSIGGRWGVWSFWSSCSVTCDNGVNTRHRICESLAFDQPCTGDSLETRQCNNGVCAVHGGWSSWSQWGFCSVTCGTGSRVRDRSCDFPIPENGGNSCGGDSFQSETCFKEPCSITVNGGWGFWSQWSSCSLTCGNGTQTRNRRCDNPSPANGGSYCIGDIVGHQNCLEKYCPIDGGFSEWTLWSPCTAKCLGDRGDRVRRRFCSNPTPKHGGRPCSGNIKEKQFCTGTVPKQENDPSSICFHIGEK